MKKILLPMLLCMSFVLAACDGSAKSDFPTGKFIIEGKTDEGMIFNQDGTFTAFNGTYTLVNATYKVEGNVLTETSNDGGCDTNISFNYTFDGSKLHFTYVGNPEDDKACDGRYAGFNNVTYVLTQ